MWRQNNPHIVNFWSTLNAAAMEVVQRGARIPIQNGRLELAREYDHSSGLDFMTVRLPSGRKLFYPQPHIGVNRFGSPSVCYWGVNQTTRKWEEIETYGGKLAENITQAVARDCLAEAIERLEAAGYRLVFHVHDEVVIEAPTEQADLEDVVRIMSIPPAWAPDLPLKADGWVNPFFKKD